jgi:hypothetical protein
VVVLALAAGGCSTVVRTSVGPGGHEASGPSTGGLVSADGRYVAFSSEAPDLVTGDGNGVTDAFLHDHRTGTTTRVALDLDGGELDRESTAVALSRSGRVVAFVTEAPIDPADTNARADVYVRDLDTGTTEWVSRREDGSPVWPAGQQAATIADVSISDDGSRVMTLLSEPGAGLAWVYDRTAHVSKQVATLAARALLTGDGRQLVELLLCPNSTCVGDSRVVTVADGTSTTIDPECAFDALAVSADARFVVGWRRGGYPTFSCPGPTGLVRWDRDTATFRAVPGGGPRSVQVSIATSGRFVAFVDDAGLPQVSDLATNVVQRADRGWSGAVGSPPASRIALSASGRYVTFTSEDPALVPDDENGVADVVTRYAITPSVSGAVPSGVARGSEQVIVVLTGAELLPGVTAAVSGSGVSVDAATLMSPTKLRLTVSVDATAAPGPRDVTVSNRGGFGHADARCGGCLTVT